MGGGEEWVGKYKSSGRGGGRGEGVGGVPTRFVPQNTSTKIRATVHQQYQLVAGIDKLIKVFVN